MRSFSMIYLMTVSVIAVGAAHADEADDTTIVVTAARSPQPLSRVGQSITVIDAVDIARRQTDDVAAILRTVPGVTIARNGGVGNSTSVFVRGAESDQTVALIDGIKLNDPSSPGGGFNFGNLLTGNIERIEVLRGAQSVLYGSQAIGGVVNMITAPPSEELTVNLRGECGYRDTAQLVGNVSGRTGPLSASVGAGYFRTDGISAFAEDRGGIEHDGYRDFGANANFNLALGDGISIDARGWYSDGKVGIDGSPAPSFTFRDTLEMSRTRELVGYTGLNVALVDARFRNRLGYAHTGTRRRNEDAASTPTTTFRSSGRNERFEYQGVFDIAEGWQATGGLERETSRFETGNGLGVSSRGRARLDSIYAQLLTSPIDDLTLTGGVRHDDHDRFGGATTWATSGVFTPGGKGTTIRASYGEGFKAPSLFQLQSEYGNQLLRPETSKGWDAGVTQRLLDARIEASATYFQRTSRDLINFVSCFRPFTGICAGRPSGTYDNVARARADGVELGLTVRPVDAMRLQANYTFTNSRNRSPGNVNFDKQLVRRPRQSASTLVDYRWPFGLETGATVTMVGASFDTANNSRRVAGYVLADIRASLRVDRNIEIFGRVENLFDENYETIFRYGTPGRAAYIGGRLSIR